jgi:hypothetical protein
MRFSIVRLLVAFAVLAGSFATVRFLAGFGRANRGEAMLLVRARAGGPEAGPQEIDARALELHAQRVLSPAVLDRAADLMKGSSSASATGGPRAADPHRELRRRLRAEAIACPGPKGDVAGLVIVSAFADSREEATEIALSVANAYCELEGPKSVTLPTCWLRPAERWPILDRPWKVGAAMILGLSATAAVFLVPAGRRGSLGT